MVASGDDDDGQRSERVAGDREDAGRPESEHVLRFGDVAPGDLGFERNRERHPDREAGVHEDDGRSPATPDQEQRPRSEQRRRQERAAEVVDAERGFAPARGGTPGERSGREGEGSEGRGPGQELRPAVEAETLREVGRKPQGDERRTECQKGLH